jgi:predicted ribosome quality control (RQC) complex YloA/Tae2 family protein
LNPQKNAEIFYRKAKNQQIEINKLKEAITQKENEILKLKEWIGLTDETSELKELRKIVVEAGLDKKKQGQTETLPFHEFEFKGYKILVGKNAESNDKLTLKYSYKDDLWLHAKDVAGSHVLVKYQSGKNFPKDVIEYAAGLAAYNSKRKNESLCPVAFTQKKFVRKRKGDPAGMVVVEREEVILVEPIKA